MKKNAKSRPAEDIQPKKKDIRRVIQWAGDALGLQHWAIGYEYSEAPPAWANDHTDQGEVTWDVKQRTAGIWIRPSAADPIATAIHEVLHIAFADCGLASEGETHAHGLIYRLEAALNVAYTETQK